ncbi:rifin [Plasmodium falciparum RAJ116]|uniref:Rifin n=1 Tax=Plasmodium falciparum RAJ116 TaxID=580058 RepID=A0A0L0CSK0_PLAFA|nr:rifin [Plasmodium falciparum RAJ116]
MKVHYINILLFVIPLNILINDQRNHKNITHHTPKISTTRLLCECDIYTSIYDNDPQMKAVMENYNRQTSDRFKEYDERMKTTRQEYKEQCDKEIQKIILKDKMEKQMAQQLTTLETKIDTNDIPTCICEKSMADKVEKTCLKCGSVFGGIAPSVGLLGGLGIYVWKPGALKVAIEAALEEGATRIAAASEAAGNARGMEVVIFFLEQLHIDKLVPGICEEISRTGNYTNVINFSKLIIQKRGELCGVTSKLGEDMCKKINIGLGTIERNGRPGLPDATAIPARVNAILDKATLTAKGKAAEVTTSKTLAIKAAQKEAIEVASYNLYSAIGYSILAILIIVLIMIIIYLILRYRRKKKMKKKLQYIKLLEE